MSCIGEVVTRNLGAGFKKAFRPLQRRVDNLAHKNDSVGSQCRLQVDMGVD